VLDSSALFERVHLCHKTHVFWGCYWNPAPSLWVAVARGLVAEPAMTALYTARQGRSGRNTPPAQRLKSLRSRVRQADTILERLCTCATACSAISYSDNISRGAKSQQGKAVAATLFLVCERLPIGVMTRKVSVSNLVGRNGRVGVLQAARKWTP
jgi:hypothetical protein